MSTTIPSQRLEALEKANQVRTTARQFKERLAALSEREAVLEAARVLVEEPDTVGAVKVYTFLDAVPSLGVSRIERMLKRHEIWPLRAVWDLTRRWRTVLAAELVRYARRDEKVVPPTAIQRAILERIEYGEVPALALDIAVEVGLPRRGVGPRLRGLENRGLVRRVVGEGRESGWVLTQAGRGELVRHAGGLRG